MVTSDSKTDSSPTTSIAPDSPPSYDFATSLPLVYTHDDSPSSSAGGSSSQPQQTQQSQPGRAPPKQIQHLFSGPPNAEPLLGKSSAPLARVQNVQGGTKWNRWVSTDPALQDPAVLYDWLRYQTLQTPKIKLKIQGAHTVIPERDEYVDDNGTMRQFKKGQPERIIDFDFWIDLNDLIDHPENQANISLCALGPSHPANRGTFKFHYGALHAPPLEPPHSTGVSHTNNNGYTALDIAQEYSITDVGAPCTKAENKLFTETTGRWKFGKGLPTWIRAVDQKGFWEDQAAKKKGKGKKPVAGEIALGDEESQLENRTAGCAGDNVPALKAWCEKYCSDKRLLKSFTFRKWIWGWETAALETAIKGAILSTGYQSNDVKVEWDIQDYLMTVRPPNFLSRGVWNTPWYLMFLVLLLYPFIWVWQRTHALGGAPYELAIASYAMKYYPPLPNTFPSETIEQAQDRLPSLYKLHPELPKSPILQPGPKGIHYLLGRKEGEWFREWEERIRMGVKMRFKGELQTTRVGDWREPSLDGY